MVDLFVEWCFTIALLILSLSFFIVTIRLIIGPTFPDRVLALDALVTIGIGYIVVVAISTANLLYVDIAIALGLVGFLATVAFARFLLRRSKTSNMIARELETEDDHHLDNQTRKNANAD